MTDVLQPRTAAAEPASRRRWSRRRTTRGLIGVASAALGVAAWVLVPGAVAVGQTRVMLDAEPFTCATATDATTWADGDFVDPDQRVHLPALRLHPGLDCTMDVLVSNDSDADIDVDGVTIPMTGPGNGWGVHADRSHQQASGPSGARDARDALDALDATFDFVHGPAAGGAFGMAPHTVQRFRFHLSWSGGCMDPGSSAVFTDAPTATISAGPWRLAKSWSGPGYAFLGGQHTVAARCG